MYFFSQKTRGFLCPSRVFRESVCNPTMDLRPSPLPDLTSPLTVGDTVTYWTRKRGAGSRAHRVWCEVLDIAGDVVEVRAMSAPRGEQEFWMERKRLTKADPAEGRR